MEKAAYLDAMGITRWSPAHVDGPVYRILIDTGASVAASHPIVASVLALVGAERQVVISEALKGTQPVFWDMRSVKHPQVPCVIASPPLKQLEQQSEAKRALWQAIYQADDL